MTILVLELTDRVIPAEHYKPGDKVIHRMTNLESMSLTQVMQECRHLLDMHVDDIHNFSGVYIVCELAHKSVVALNFIVFALQLILIFPEVWLATKEQGFYLSMQGMFGEAQDWAMTTRTLALETAKSFAEPIQ
jgi:hypothetical protein